MSSGSEVRLVDLIRPGDRVTIRTPHGQERTGRAVMRSAVGGWVLNMGGPHGTPGLADENNIAKVRRAQSRCSTKVEVPVIYARHEPTTDEMVQGQGMRDVVYYRDAECTEFYAREPWHYRSKPTRRNKHTTLNCYLYRLIWVKDLP